jgi:hypothetical protein
LKKFLVGLLADLVADRDFVILALMQALAVTRVMKPLNLVLKSPGEKPTRNVSNSALTQLVAAVSLMNMPILVWLFAKTSLIPNHLVPKIARETGVDDKTRTYDEWSHVRKDYRPDPFEFVPYRLWCLKGHRRGS